MCPKHVRMNGTLRGFLRLYPIVRNWTVLSNNIISLQSICKVSRHYSTNLIDHTQLEDCISPIDNVKNQVSIDTKIYPIEILNKAARNYTSMTLCEAIDTIYVLFTATKNVEENLQETIKTHIGFVRLWGVLNKNVRFMKTIQIIKSLRMAIYFKLPNNCILFQSLLQMIRVNVNEISPQDIISIVVLLRKMDSSPLRDALLIALPLVFEVQAPTKLDTDNIYVLTRSLRFISETNISNLEVQNAIIKPLLKFENNLDVHMASSIFYSLCVANYLSPIALELLFNVQKILISEIKQLNISEIMTTINKLSFAVTKHKEYRCKFYNEALMDALINAALSAEIYFNNGINLLKLMNEFNYAHIPFLEYLAAKCFEQPNLLKGASYFKISIFLEGLINADYKPVFWDTIRDAILANKVEDKIFNNSMIKFTLHLIALDCYSPNLISKVFSQVSMTETRKDIHMRELLLLYQSVKTLYPMYNGSWPSQDILDYAVNIHKTLLNPIFPTSSLKSVLELALGGPQYVHNDLRTKLGHYIDHVIVMRKGGYPIAINTITSTGNNIMYVEDIQTPSESQMILIFNLPDTAYAINSQRLKSTWSLKIKSVEALVKTETIAINSNSWIKLPEYERLPYLMRAIRLKCGDDSFLAR
ncbi:uncharacterized protein LOC105423363 isoform X2 [Pogonomyrmex barbatus]|uniref:Uncharacterized protein LOC105423363 isoform X2 n=1 Tax=Pogonomyrmex barbatus TaxID=144034 RepID=A0A6I9VZB9_9HYME|nr:uncharacterized protein LOC105423363 isoform X2 [Pogonomyrmex barbatus]